MGKKAILLTLVVILIIFAYITYSYDLFGGLIGKVLYNGNYRVTNINIYRDTPAWKLALAVRNQKTEAIEKNSKEWTKVIKLSGT